MSLPDKLNSMHYTYKDYITWDDDFRCEIIDGQIYAMTAPNLFHQSIVGALYAQLREFLKDKSCKVYLSPVDVRLNPDKDDDTVVQPDVIVVCDAKKTENKKHVLGAPDLVIEVLSTSTAHKDVLTKYHKYLEAAVKEYWIVNPETKTVNVFVLNNNVYNAYVYGESSDIPVTVLNGCYVNMTETFAQ